MKKIGIGLIVKDKNLADHNLSVINNEYNTYTASCFNINTKLKPTDTFSFNREVCNTWIKNHLLRMMINDGCQHLFIIDDSIEILNKHLFEEYIKHAETTGIYCLQFKENNVLRNALEYTNNIEICFSEKITSSFTYIACGIPKAIGFYDERYDRGLLDHTDFLYRTMQAKIIPPWGWFADIKNSDQYLKKTTTLQNDKDFWYECNWFKHKYGVFPFEVAQPEEHIVLNDLERIKNTYGK